MNFFFFYFSLLRMEYDLLVAGILVLFCFMLDIVHR